MVMDSYFKYFLEEPYSMIYLLTVCIYKYIPLVCIYTLTSQEPIGKNQLR